MASVIFSATIPILLTLVGSGPSATRQGLEAPPPQCVPQRVLGITPSDIRAGQMASVEGRFHVVLYNGGHAELWRSDGTLESAFRVTTLPDIGALAAAGRRLFFTASTPESGMELWITEGTPESTRLVADLTPGADGTAFAGFAALGETLFFMAGDSTLGYSLWRSDGTAGGTSVIKSFSPGLSLQILREVNGRLVILLSSTATFDQELWASDGTLAGTQLLTTARVGAFIAQTQGAIYTFAQAPVWRTDGTPEGTRQLQRTWFYSAAIPHCCYFTNEEQIGVAGKIFVRQRFQYWPDGPSPSPEFSYILQVANPEDVEPFIQVGGDVRSLTSVHDQFLVGAGATVLIWVQGSDLTRGSVALPTEVRSPAKLFPSGKYLYFVPSSTVGGEEVWAMRLACLIDHTPPQLQCPERVVAKTKSRDGAAVSYPPATATDDQSTDLDVTYDMPSGSVFPVGVTTVTATTQDEAGQEASCSFEVEVQREGGSCDCSVPDTSSLPWAALLLLVPFVARRRGGAPG